MKQIIAGLLALGLAQATAAEAEAMTQEELAERAKLAEYRAKRDRLPSDFFKRLEAYNATRRDMQAEEQKAFLSVGIDKVASLPKIQWDKPVVTVAFHGGDDETYKLIEEAAMDWTSKTTKFSFQFRDNSNAYLQWSPTDTSPKADIRIGFISGGKGGGYWSDLGSMATQRKDGEATMNLENFPDDLKEYYNGRNQRKWKKSYVRGTVLHEFGHALGLDHEHFHPECQAEFVYYADPDYEHKHALDDDGNENGPLKADDKGRTPGLLQYYEGAPNHWLHKSTLFNLWWEEYASEMGVDPKNTSAVFSKKADAKSVMLYDLPAEMFANRDKSKCYTPSPATKLSKGDKAFFKKHYDRDFTP